MNETAFCPLNAHLIRFWVDDTEPHRIAEQLDPEIRLTWGDAPPEDCHLLVAGRPQAEHLAACPDLKWVIIPWAGVAEETRQVLRAYPHLSVHNAHYNAAATAEMALALLLAAAKSLILTDQAMRSNDWRHRSRPDLSVQLDGKTALILGYGEIGHRVGRALQALGVRVLAVRRHAANKGGYIVPTFTLDSISRLLPQADLLILTLPLTPETYNVIGERELSLLPERAILVNVGRGALVDPKALYQALKQGRLFAAGLDVWYNYPRADDDFTNTPPADYPFGELDNVVMSPHRGGSSIDADPLRIAELAEMINAAARGEPLPNRVDVGRGY